MNGTQLETTMNPLRAFRKERHLTANKVANELGLTERTVLAYETGAFRPSNARLSDIAHLMGVEFNLLDSEWSWWQETLKNA